MPHHRRATFIAGCQRLMLVAHDIDGMMMDTREHFGERYQQARRRRRQAEIRQTIRIYTPHLKPHDFGC